MRLCNDIWRYPVIKGCNRVFEGEFSPFEPLKRQHIWHPTFMQRMDRFVQIPVLLLENSAFDPQHICLFHLCRAVHEESFGNPVYAQHILNLFIKGDGPNA